MNTMDTDNGATEIARIRAEYLRRSQAIPRDFYAWSRPANYFLHSQTARACIHALDAEGAFPLDGKKVLDVGCGAGSWLLEFAQWGADELCGIDLDRHRIEKAARRLPAAGLHAGDARRLPWADAAFDVVTQFTLFTSILDPAVKRTIAAEMCRVLVPGGLVLWYDFRFNNPRNPNVRGIGGREIRALFPGCAVKLKRATLAPPIARPVAALCWDLALALEHLPFLRSHYVAVIRKP